VINDFEVILHRGHNQSRGENSLAGIEEIRALDKNFMIEVDVCITADDTPILFHDLTLDRLCGTSGIVMETNFADLGPRSDGEPIARLVDALERYPGQKFLLDLRTHVHADFMRGSSISPESLEPALNKIVPAVKDLLTPAHRSNIRLVAGNPDHRAVLMEAFPDFEVDIPEQFSRDYLQYLSDHTDASILGPNVRRMYIRFREIKPEIITWAHQMGLKIIANHAPSQRSLENSRMMLNKSLEWGMDGLTTSPIDTYFLDTWRDRKMIGAV